MSAEEELLEQVVNETAPGESNEVFRESWDAVGTVIGTFIDETNNWFDIKKVHVYQDKLGVTARYRWTIERWIASETEEFLEDNDWSVAPHTHADWDGREENELEIRMSKELLGVPVYGNFLVEMTERAFEALEENETIVLDEEGANEHIRSFLDEDDEVPSINL